MGEPLAVSTMGAGAYERENEFVFLSALAVCCAALGNERGKERKEFPGTPWEKWGFPSRPPLCNPLAPS